MRKPARLALPLLLALALLLQGCDRETTLAQVGLQVNIGLNGGAKTLGALERAGKLDPLTYRRLLSKIAAAQRIADQLNAELDRLAVIDAADRPALLRQIGELSGAVADIISEIPETKDSADVIFYLRLAKAALTGASVSVAALKAPAAPGDVRVKVQKVGR